MLGAQSGILKKNQSFYSRKILDQLPNDNYGNNKTKTSKSIFEKPENKKINTEQNHKFQKIAPKSVFKHENTKRKLSNHNQSKKTPYGSFPNDQNHQNSHLPIIYPKNMSGNKFQTEDVLQYSKKSIVDPSILKKKTKKIFFQGIKEEQNNTIDQGVVKSQQKMLKSNKIISQCVKFKQQILSSHAIQENKIKNIYDINSLPNMKNDTKKELKAFRSISNIIDLQQESACAEKKQQNQKLEFMSLSEIKSKRLLRKQSAADSLNSGENFISSKLIDKKNITFHNISQSLKSSGRLNTSKSLKDLFSQKEFDDQFISVQDRKVIKIAQGSHATVFRVKRDDLGVVALKRINHYKNTNMKEIQIMQKLEKHPFIAHLQGVHYMSQHCGKFIGLLMEYYEDGDLGKKIWSQGTFSFQKVKLYAYQILRGLHYIHSHQIIHRDIRSQNIFVRGDKLVIGDFGSAKFNHDNQCKSSYICSRPNRAPELAFGAKKYDAKIDVWAVGCVIVQMILGRNLFNPHYSSDLLHQIVRIRGTPSAQYIKQISPQKKNSRFSFLQKHIKQKKWEQILEQKILPQHLSAFLDGLFEYNPSTRLSALQALKHKYFDSIRNQQRHTNKSRCYQYLDDLFAFLPQQISPDDKKILLPSWFKNHDIVD